MGIKVDLVVWVMYGGSPVPFDYITETAVCSEHHAGAEQWPLPAF